ncbi:MAG: hypothetical protein H0V23_14865 [Nocardioidaceae bacterium]|nr:hypothetical protein [Nocardioidaceae bacterium]
MTFVRRQPGSHAATGAKARAVRLAKAEPDLILVACVKQKLSVPSAAKNLYISTLFRKGRAYAERASVPWFILSAEHGLVDPDDELAPYDLRLSKTPPEYRGAWGVRVVEKLAAVIGPLASKTIEVHAGAA